MLLVSAIFLSSSLSCGFIYYNNWPVHLYLELEFHIECKVAVFNYYSILCFITIITWTADLIFQTIYPPFCIIKGTFPWFLTKTKTTTTTATITQKKRLMGRETNVNNSKSTQTRS